MLVHLLSLRICFSFPSFSAHFINVAGVVAPAYPGLYQEGPRAVILHVSLRRGDAA